MTVQQSVVNVRWIGPSDETWNLMSGADGAVITGGLDSLVLPDFSLRMVKKARMPGARYGGINWSHGVASIPVTVGDNAITRPEGNYRRGSQWLDLDARFRSSFSMFAPGRLEVETPSGIRKFYGYLSDLEVEWSGDGKMPDIRGSQKYTVHLAAELPFYEGSSVDYDFPYTVGDSTLQYFGTSGGPSFYIAQGASIGNATALNASQIESWPKWTLTGPGAFRVGVGEHVTEVAYLLAGQQLILDTNPHSTSATDGYGNRAWDMVGQYDFAPVPPGEASSISAQVIGGGVGANVRMTLPTWYLSAW